MAPRLIMCHQSPRHRGQKDYPSRSQHRPNTRLGRQCHFSTAFPAVFWTSFSAIKTTSLVAASNNVTGMSAANAPKATATACHPGGRSMLMSESSVRSKFLNQHVATFAAQLSSVIPEKSRRAPVFSSYTVSRGVVGSEAKIFASKSMIVDSSHPCWTQENFAISPD